jgi:S-adenosylmethionine-diacylgycerolhomoserine-N-methlytransferase
VLYNLTLKRVSGHTHAERLENFYAGQAADYDRFRRRMLYGRRELWQALAARVSDCLSETVWVDLGAGTAANFEAIANQVPQFRRVYWVDLSASLLAVAKQRQERAGWQTVEIVESEAETFRLPPGERADIVTFSYSLTMTPNWFAAIDNALLLLKPGGLLGVVDFYVSRQRGESYLQPHSWGTRWFWRMWFEHDGVLLSPDHIPYLRSRTEPLQFEASRAQMPYLPLLQVPFYGYIGRKPLETDLEPSSQPA